MSTARVTDADTVLPMETDHIDFGADGDTAPPPPAMGGLQWSPWHWKAPLVMFVIWTMTVSAMYLSVADTARAADDTARNDALVGQCVLRHEPGCEVVCGKYGGGVVCRYHTAPTIAVCDAAFKACEPWVAQRFVPGARWTGRYVLVFFVACCTFYIFAHFVARR